ncbi:tRNAse Z TRZ4, mitochondrial isoform X1 [Capsicum annuum]|uniref:tRNAse Z TRZ4, mitochondrial isoform X1 n=2 Tax=Capsicum annuum TaxID=4072 RepID=UPI001FB0B444|nr:tRNAse Z TRZ4, mitochondrial isoform X1 [Capsicum annuum]
MTNPENNVHTNTKAYVQILGTGMDTQETSPSVLLCFDKERFIFNAGEGLQRFCMEYKIKLSQVDHICLTRVCSETAGGLPVSGLLLTLAGMKDESPQSAGKVQIWGPPNLNLLVNAMKTFVPHAVMKNKNCIPQSGSALVPPLHAEELRADGKFKAVSISAILLSPTHFAGSHFSPNDTSIVYICKLHDITGKVDKDKAKACGLNPGRKLGQLQKGFSVKSDFLDIEVHPDDVIGPTIPGPIVLIVDCPTEPHAQELLSAQALEAYYSDSQSNSPDTTKVVNCIIHLGPATVINSPVYEKWMGKFDSAQHIMARTPRKHETTPILVSSAKIGTRLHYLCPQLFPAPSLPSVGDDVGTPHIKGSACGIFAENLLKFTLRPPRDMGLDRSSVENPTTSSVFIEELLSEIPEIADAAKNISKFWHKPKDEVELSNRQDSGDVVTEEPSKFSAPRCLENVQRDDLEIVFLGTGSSVPSKYRNVSSIHVNLFSKGGLLLDCGEGTLAQLKRRYGIIGADSAVRNLKCIWISHIHADHHAGVARILALRRDLLKGVAHDRILVIGPKQVGEFLMEYIKLEDLDMLFLDCKSTTVAAWDNMEADSMYVESRDHTLLTSLSEDSPLQHCSKKMKLSTPVDDITLLKCFRKVLSEAGLVRLISFPVVHCPDTEAFGVILESAERMNHDKVVPGWKVVYSGDTRPCSQVIEASLGATILIHEATFEDGLVEEAIARNHSTIKEAIEVGDSAGAYRVILTHFSQRYPKVPALDEVSMQTTCIAFDLMSVNLADLPVLPKVLPYLKLLFRNSG